MQENVPANEADLIKRRGLSDRENTRQALCSASRCIGQRHDANVVLTTTCCSQEHKRLMLSERTDRDCVMRSDYAGTPGKDPTRKIQEEYTRGDATNLTLLSKCTREGSCRIRQEW